MAFTIPIPNPGGFITNVAYTDEPPLVLPRCICNGRPSFDRGENDPAGVRPDPNYADAAYSLDLGVVGDRPNVFGEAFNPEHCNADTYLDEDERENIRRARELRVKLGLSPLPGFPKKSFG